MKMPPDTRLKILSRLERQSGGKLEMFFASSGLGDAYAAPGKNWGKAKHIASAMTEADKRGQGDDVLSAAATHFGLLDDEDTATTEADTDKDDLGLPPKSWQGPAEISDAAEDPTSSSEDELCLMAFQAWDKTGEWPTARVLQRRIERGRGRLDVDATGRALDPAIGYVEQQHNGRVVLRIGGIIGIPSAKRYVSAFLDVIQLAYRRYIGEDTSELPVLSDEVVRDELSLDPDMTWRVYSLMDAEAFLLESGGSQPEAKTFRRDISPQIRFFRDVRSSEDYVRARASLLRPRNIPLDTVATAPANSAHGLLGGPSATGEQGNQVFHTVIFGGNAAIGPNATIQLDVRPGDLPSLLAFLAREGVDEADREALREAIESDERSRDVQRPGTRVREWLGRMSFKLAATGARVGEQTGATLIAAAIAKYLGLL